MPPGGTDRRTRFIIGVSFIAVSFLAYPTYIAIPFLPLSNTLKVKIVLLASIASWGTFFIGFYLSGRDGYEWLKRRLRR